jgi:hypothetical protein
MQMPALTVIQNGSFHHWVLVRPEPPGQFTAQALGIPGLCSTAVTREEALQQVRTRLGEWLTTGQLVSVEVPQENHLLQWFGRVDPTDPNEQAYLEELEHFRKEDLERTLRELDQECSNSSSTPTT